MHWRHLLLSGAVFIAAFVLAKAVKIGIVALSIYAARSLL